jgi:23S rRNA (pseudouridine1915-N3)-methyltransferase
LIAVGRLRSSYRQAADDYLKRLQRFWPTEEREVREAIQATDTLKRRDEGRRLLDAIPADAVVVALTRRGSGWSSEEVARRLGRWRDGRGGRDLAFLIGGSLGLSDEVLAAADASWSLGPLTLPHELARVVVLEQLYRAATILQGHPYHKPRT